MARGKCFMCMFHPLSQCRHFYVMFMVLLTFAGLVSLPLELAFPEAAENSAKIGWMAFSLFSDFLFIMDIFLNFQMGIYIGDDDEPTFDRKIIRNTYLKTWFAVDLLSSFPVGVILILLEHYYEDESPTQIAAFKLSKKLMFARAISLLRFLRVSKLVRFFREMEQFSDRNLEKIRMMLSIIPVFMSIFLLCHWIGCLQFFVPMLQNFPNESWVVQENLLNASVTEKYSFAFFRAVSHMFGNNNPAHERRSGPDVNEHWFVIVSKGIGFLIFGLLLAKFWQMMEYSHMLERKFKNRILELKDWMEYKNLPKPLRKRILQYYNTYYRGKWYNEKYMLQIMSICMRERIRKEKCEDLLYKVPLFQNRSKMFIRAVLLKLKFEMFGENDVVLQKNAPCDCMYFIEHGQVSVEDDEGAIHLSSGDYFGVIDPQRRRRQLYQVRVLTDTRMYSLCMKDLNKILIDYPDDIV